MTQDIHDAHGAGFVHLRNLLPAAESFATTRKQRGTLGGSKQLSLFPEENAINAYRQKAFREDWVKGDARGKRERREPAGSAAVDKSWMPNMLAEKLRDEQNLAFYKFVVRRLPEEIVRDALMRALDVPQRNIRRSRGALFASILAPYLKTRRRPRTQSESSAT